MRIKTMLGLAVFASSVMFAPAWASDGPQFGDDAGEYANDGECDDMRFEGEGMTTTPLLAEDIFHDASDCRTAFEAGRLTISSLFLRLGGDDDIVWGDDEGEWARDGECDDLRFTGSGMTDTALMSDDVGHDATDCRVAYQQGRIAWRDGPVDTVDPQARRIVWGDDEYSGASNGVCDDMRFEGEGMAPDPLSNEAIKHDAQDCRDLFENGSIELRS